MGLLSRLSSLINPKPKFQDEQIVMRAENALSEDPIISNLSELRVSSKNGVVSLMGPVVSDREKHHVEGTVRSALKQSGLKFEQIENQLSIRR